MTDTLLIVDQASRWKATRLGGQGIDANYEAQVLAFLIKVFGPVDRRLAIVSQEDHAGLRAYQGAGYETLLINGSRSEKLRKLGQDVLEIIETTQPKQVVLVSNDPAFAALCERILARGGARLAVWTPGDDVPAELAKPAYGHRLLQELQIGKEHLHKVDIRLDYENLIMGLAARGLSTDPEKLVNVVKTEAAAFGNVVRTVAYADWSLLNQLTKTDLQRKLAELGVDTRYVISLRGKNSADMKIADDVSNLIERDPEAADGAHIVVLGSCDRDFVPLVKRINGKSRSLVILALEQGISGLLKSAARETSAAVRYLDPYFTPPLVEPETLDKPAVPHFTPWDKHAGILMRLCAYLQKQSWQWAYADIVAADLFGGDEQGLNQACQDGAIVSNMRSLLAKGGVPTQRLALALHPQHPLAQAVSGLAAWLPTCIRSKMASSSEIRFSSQAIADEIAHDTTLQRLGIGCGLQEVDGWLYLAAEAGLVVNDSKPKNGSTGHQTKKWGLAS